METKHEICGATHLWASTQAGADTPSLVATCQRPKNHDGKHMAVWFNGTIAWELSNSTLDGLLSRRHTL